MLFRSEQSQNIERLINCLSNRTEQPQESVPTLSPSLNDTNQPELNLPEFTMEDFRIPLMVLKSLFVPTLIYDAIKRTGIFENKSSNGSNKE